VPRVVAEREDVLPTLAEIFREHGFEGASLSLIGRRTGLGKSSLYHFFPGGKEEMAAAVLKNIEAWFEANIFLPLEKEADPHRALENMLRAVEAYFQSGRRVCLVGALALGDARDRFAEPIRAYFARWRDTLAEALQRAGLARADAKDLAEEAIAALQGALVLARALDDPGVFRRTLNRLKARLPARARPMRSA